MRNIKKSTLQIRISDEEKTKIRANAERADCSTSDYVRDRALGKNPEATRTAKKMSAALVELTRLTDQAPTAEALKRILKDWSDNTWRSLK